MCRCSGYSSGDAPVVCFAVGGAAVGRGDRDPTYSNLLETYSN